MDTYSKKKRFLCPPIYDLDYIKLKRLLGFKRKKMEIVKYDAGRLRNQFAVLKETSAYTLQCVFHAAARGWLKQLPQNNISDVVKLSGPYCAPYENHHLVVDGKIVQFTIPFDYNCPVLFLGNDKEPVGKAADAFGKFVQSQSLEYLVKKTAEQLKKNKGMFP